ncbi:ankyrin repeat domain-containing protein [Legionella worsleiensis]|uniref:Ankyrin repeats (3 copies) n=1 Tax=Legionella worsleiensis TaxID=45076 RepID=A0A0W1AFB2_9GAMM|nr:ankyrin repeat domain-containing protein [Legionella worsleiensis]KTD80018.1 hypothetical protein Lwor_1532 [Legionella worsleiensis]STY32490.1 Uncharacterised protein [Legionella worsleiensis]
MKFIKILSEIAFIKKSRQNTDTRKLPEHIKEKVMQRDRVNQEKAEGRFNRLLDRVRQANGPVAADYVARICSDDTPEGGDATRYAASSSQADSGIGSGNKPWSSYVNRFLYQKIILLCKLAYLQEQSGNPKKHARKLSCIFDSEKAIYHYLINFPKWNKVTNLVFDACRFTLPSLDPRHFLLWKKRAQILENMLNPRFRILLAHAAAIKRMSLLGQFVYTNIGQIKVKETELANTIRRYQVVAQSPVKHPDLNDKRARQDKLSYLSREKERLYLELAALARGIRLEHASLLVLQAFYEEYKYHNDRARRLLVRYGIREQTRAVFDSLKRDNDDKAIPAITIKGSEVGFPKTYLTKLNTSVDEEAALAVCLGKLTYCCQSLDGDAYECVVHGIGSPNGAFYVLFSGDEDHLNLHDPVLAQAWVWRSTGGDLCLDSIEVSHNVSISLVITMYRYLGMLLCEEKGINRVNTGVSCGVTDRVSLADYPVVSIKPVDYYGYTSATRQSVLAEKSMFFIHYQPDTSKLFQQLIIQRTRLFLSSLFHSPEPLINNERFKKMIAYLVYKKQDMRGYFLYDLMLDLAQHRLEELEQLLAINRTYYTVINETGVHYSLKMMLDWHKKGAYIGSMNQAGWRFVNYQEVISEFKSVVSRYLSNTSNPALLSFSCSPITSMALTSKNYPFFKKWVKYFLEIQLLFESEALINWVGGILSRDASMTQRHLNIFNLFPKSHRFNIIRSGERTTPLHLMASNPVMLSAFLNRILKAQRLDAVKLKNNYGFLVLQSAIAYPESLAVIFKSLTEKDRLAVLKLTHYDGTNLLHLALAYRESLDTILKFIPYCEALSRIKRPDSQGNLLLHHTVAYSDSLRIVLALYPDEDHLNAICYANHKGNTVLHQAAIYPESLRILLEFYPPQERLRALLQCNNSGASVLHLASKKTKSMSVILELLPEDQRLGAIIYAGISDNINAPWHPKTPQSPDEEEIHYWSDDEVNERSFSDDELVFEEFTSPEALSTFLRSLTEAQRLDTLCQVDEFGNTMLHRAVTQPDFLGVILTFLPELHKLRIVSIANNAGDTALHLAVKHHQSLQMVLDVYPEDQKRDAVCQVNYWDFRVLDCAVDCHHSLKILLELFSQDQLGAVVAQVMSNGQTLLHEAVTNPLSLRIILDMLPQEQRLEVISLVNQSGDRVLDCALAQCKSVHIILEIYPPDQRFEALFRINYDAQTLMQFILENPGILGVIFDLLPEEQWINAIIQHDKFGRNLLHYAESNLSLLRTLLEKIPVGQRLDAIKDSCSSGWGLLRQATANLDLANLLFELIMVQQRLDAFRALIAHIREPGTDAIKPEILTVIFESLPESQRLKALLLICKSSPYLLFLSQNHHDILVAIQDLIPELKGAKRELASISISTWMGFFSGKQRPCNHSSFEDFALTP